MMDYTKGEWKVISDPLGKFTDIFGEAGMPIATITHYSTGRQQDSANANLIASAPDLYEALNELTEAVRHNRSQLRARILGVKALAKAEINKGRRVVQ